MSRPWRIEYEGALYHLLSRGNERSDIFIGEKDRNGFLDAVGEMSERFDIDIFAYVLMDNHYHLLVKQVGNNGISNTIRLLQNSYAKYVNTRQNRHGSLFQSPFKAVLVNSGEQFIHVARYIHLNPLTSYLIKNFTDLNSFPWCSYQDYISDNRKFIDTSRIINIHKSKSKFIEFTQNNLDYQRSLNQIKHLTHQE